MKRTYDFATIGFRPFPETQEFVTMGVVALDTAARQFDFVLQDARKTGRVLAMFPKAGKALYREARATGSGADKHPQRSKRTGAGRQRAVVSRFSRKGRWSVRCHHQPA